MSEPRPEDRVQWDAWWRDGAERAVAVLASSGDFFTASALREPPFCLPEPRHPNHLGALFSAARATGLITPVGWQPSSTPSRRYGVVRVWRGSPHCRQHEPQPAEDDEA